MKAKMMMVAVLGMMAAGCGGGVAMKDMKGQTELKPFDFAEGKMVPNPKIVVDTKIGKDDLKSLSRLRFVNSDGKAYGGSISAIVDTDNQILSAFVPICFTTKKQIMPANRGNQRNAPHGAIYEVTGYMYGIHYIYDSKTGLIVTDSGLTNGMRHALPTATTFAHDGDPMTVSPELAKRSGGKLTAGKKLMENFDNIYFTDPSACIQASEFDINDGAAKAEKNKIQNLYWINILSVAPTNQKILNDFMSTSVAKPSGENYSQFVSSVLPILNSQAGQRNAKNSNAKLLAALDQQQVGETVSNELWSEADADNQVASANVPILTPSSARAIATKEHFNTLTKVSASTNGDGTTIISGGLSMMYSTYKFPAVLRTPEVKKAIKDGLNRGE